MLPERGSRCLRATVDCFSASAFLDDLCDSPIDEMHHSRDRIIAPLICDDIALDDCSSTDIPDAEEDFAEVELDEEEKEWEECMERRRMMFAYAIAKIARCGSSNPSLKGIGVYQPLSRIYLPSVGSNRRGGDPVEPVSNQEDLTPSVPRSLRRKPGRLTNPRAGHVPRGLDMDRMVLVPLDSDQMMATPSLLSSAGSEVGQYDG